MPVADGAGRCTWRRDPRDVGPSDLQEVSPEVQLLCVASPEAIAVEEAHDGRSGGRRNMRSPWSRHLAEALAGDLANGTGHRRRARDRRSGNPLPPLASRCQIPDWPRVGARPGPLMSRTSTWLPGGPHPLGKACAISLRRSREDVELRWWRGRHGAEETRSGWIRPNLPGQSPRITAQLGPNTSASASSGVLPATILALILTALTALVAPVWRTTAMIRSRIARYRNLWEPIMISATRPSA